MKKHDHIFFIENEYQYWVSQSILSKSQFNSYGYVVFGNANFESIVEEKLAHIDFPRFRAGKIKKLKKYLQYQNELNIQCDTIYIPTNVNPFLMKILKNCSFKNLCIIDDGAGALYERLEYGFFKTWLGVMLGFDKGWGLNRDVKYIFTPNPDLFSNQFIKTRLVDISRDMQVKANFIYPSLNLLNHEYDDIVLILDQPYTEDFNINKYNKKSVDILVDHVAKCGENYVLKPHPRTDLSDFTECEILPNAYRHIPAQALLATTNFKRVVSFCSSALYNAPFLSSKGPQCDSLIRLVPETPLTKPFIAVAQIANVKIL